MFYQNKILNTKYFNYAQTQAFPFVYTLTIYTSNF